MTNWKRLASLLSATHNEKGVAFILLSPEFVYVSDRVYIDMAGPSRDLTTEGRLLNPKKIREWCWRNRHCRAFQRPTAFFYSIYDPQEDRTFVGVGAVTKREVAQRMKKDSLELPNG